MLDITFRPLEGADSHILFYWRNDPDTCRFSKDRNPAVWEGHCKWFAKRLAGVEGEFYRIAQDEFHRPFGLCWMITKDDGTTEVHYRLDPVFRGKGLGKAMVHTFVKEFVHHSFVCPIIVGNERSEKIAFSLGLQPGDESLVNPIDVSDDRMIQTWA